MQVIVENTIDMSLLNGYFYKYLFDEIYNSNNKKEDKLNENSSSLCKV